MTDIAGLLRRTFLSTVAHIADRIEAGVTEGLSDINDAIRPEGRVILIAFGKASRPMARSAVEVLAPVRDRTSGLLVPANDDVDPMPPLEVVAGGHPLPTAGSFAAAKRALELARCAGPEDFVVFLVSGGGSAVLDLPIDPGVTVEEWRLLQRALIASGAPIDRINAVRMRLSAVKGGRLASASRCARERRTLFISDVPGGFESIASGPTVRCAAGVDTLQRDLDELKLWDALPATMRARARAGEIPALPSDDEVDGNAVTIADERHCRRHAAAALREAGAIVDDTLDVDDLPVGRAAEQALARVEQLRAAHPERLVAVVTTGELSVPLPAAVGVGGRNQHFTLACAQLIRGQPIAVLSCGTDGVDGNSSAAGAVADGETGTRAADAQLDVDDHLRRFDAHTLLRRLGCTIETGPTGVNVRDLRILIARPS